MITAAKNIFLVIVLVLDEKITKETTWKIPRNNASTFFLEYASGHVLP